ncbi:hemerythrin domain-containing protein [Cocleimonas flava]|uniref:Hemerythrin-like domain-containing protein n=1 Tax=Cocleimonas flava TaxID=634765 RepID=A0A4R1F388_9GAMM|nr:hemerythrin domain-containing protein [Cocleimonas flava]TCJ84861.1 hemerythrin-like domain-containing protein [Cocleimonas flava]
MHSILKGLQKDHINLAKVLDIMQLQLERIAEGDDVALALMFDASTYIQNYPDMIHHPRENKVFEVFKYRSGDEAEVFKTLIQQHEEMPDVTIKFKRLLNEAINGLGFISREELVKKIQEYIDLEREHMNLEEAVVFPLINKTLEDKDWKLLEELIETESDPLFTDKIEESFKVLYQSISGQAA